MLEWTRLTAGTERVAGENQAASGFAEAVKASLEPGPLRSQILTDPVACRSAAKTGAHLRSTVLVPAVAERDAGLCRVQHQSVHRTQAHCSVSPGDNPGFSCQAEFRSYFTGKLWASLISLPHFI